MFNVITLAIAIKTNKFLYTVTPETQWKEALDKFNSNLEALNQMEISDSYELGKHHLY